jgi:hypothetical protein
MSVICWPKRCEVARAVEPYPEVGEAEVVYEIVSGPNREGKLLFHRFWRTDYRPGLPDPPPGQTHLRAQCFLADLQGYTDRDKAEGKTVRIIDRRIQA